MPLRYAIHALVCERRERIVFRLTFFLHPTYRSGIGLSAAVTY